MDTNFGEFKMLALRSMASDRDELKDDVNNATSSMTFLHVCGFVRPISALYRTLGL